MKHLYIILIGIIIFISSLFVLQYLEVKKYKELYNKELQNVEAYRINNSSLQNKVRQYSMTIDDLRSSQDSIDKKIIEVVDELKIKDKKIEYLQYQASCISKTDTVRLADTIFISNTDIDTTILDNWFKLNLKLSYPSTIVVSPTFNSEQYVVINSKKEYNKKPSKFFFIRWFQKKHWVTEVDVIEKNPYIDVKQQKYIKVIK